MSNECATIFDECKTVFEDCIDDDQCNELEETFSDDPVTRDFFKEDFQGPTQDLVKKDFECVTIQWNECTVYEHVPIEQLRLCSLFFGEFFVDGWKTDSERHKNGEYLVCVESDHFDCLMHACKKEYTALANKVFLCKNRRAMSEEEAHFRVALWREYLSYELETENSFLHLIHCNEKDLLPLMYAKRVVVHNKCECVRFPLAGFSVDQILFSISMQREQGNLTVVICDCDKMDGCVSFIAQCLSYGAYVVARHSTLNVLTIIKDYVLSERLVTPWIMT